jgi:hypothetical protein
MARPRKAAIAQPHAAPQARPALCQSQSAIAAPGALERRYAAHQGDAAERQSSLSCELGAQIDEYRETCPELP